VLVAAIVAAAATAAVVAAATAGADCICAAAMVIARFTLKELQNYDNSQCYWYILM
jgi:hypothetical protein